MRLLPGSRHVLSNAMQVIVDVPDPPVLKTDLPTETEDLKENSTHETRKLASAPVVHNLFVKVPPHRSANFERIVKRNRTLEHEVLVYTSLLQDMRDFVQQRAGDIVRLNIPELYHGESSSGAGRDILVIEDLAERGFKTSDWFKQKLTHHEVLLALSELATFHACGLAYRMSLKEEIDDKYTFLDDDLYTSNMAKELLAKYLDSYLHFLSLLPGISEHILKLRKISGEVFQLLVKLRHPTDPLGNRFSTVCHGDMWMGNLMFKGADGSPPDECMIVDFHSAQFLSPATDLAHLLLTSTDRAYRLQHWDEDVQHYYDVFNRTLAEFGLILRHLGTTYDDFQYEVKRALRGQFLCVAFIIPIVIYCGPAEWRVERRRGASVDRKNTVRHLIQMMAITEEQSSPASTGESISLSDGKEMDTDTAVIPPEFAPLYNDDDLRQQLIDLIHTAEDLDILDFAEFCGQIDSPNHRHHHAHKSRTQATTGKHIPVY